MLKFCGSFVALITPFTHSGRVDRKALEALVEWHIQEGTDGLVCCGSTGEACTLSDAERKSIAEICVGVSAGRIPIVVGTGTCDTRQSVRLTEMAEKVGAAGCLVVTPYYNKPTQRGCIAHYAEVAKVGLPIIVYHNPARAVIQLTADTIRELAQIPGVVALKDSSRDFDLIRAVRKIGLDIFSGDDDITYEILQEGGVGSISVIGNVIPKGWRQMVQWALSLDPRAKELAFRYLPLCRAHFLETNPQCVKYVVSQMGRCSPVLRLPLVMPTFETQRALQSILLRLAIPFFGIKALHLG